MKTRLPRVLWATPHCLLDTTSGASISANQILTQLALRGWQIQILGATVFDSERGTTKLQSQWKEIEDSVGKMVRVVDAQLTHDLFVTEKFTIREVCIHEATIYIGVYIKLLEQIKPDLVMFYGGGIVEYMIVHEAKSRGIPTVKYLVNPAYTKYDRWAKDVDLIVTDTQATADLYEGYGHKLTPLGKFIDINQYLSATRDPKHILFINPSLAKGVAIVVVLALILEKIRPDIKFEIVESRCAFKDFLETVLSTLGLPYRELTNVIITPNVSDMKPIYSRARILLVPSLWWESGARVIPEALINGIPVIATNYGGNSELIGEGGFTFDLPPKMHEEPYIEVPNLEGLKPIADLIVKVFDDETYYQSLVSNAKLQAENAHDINKNTEKLINLLKNLIIENKKTSQSNLELPKPLIISQSSVHEKNKSNQIFSLKIEIDSADKGLFIDCGGYDGCSAVKFMLSNPSFESITFEPNPALWSSYKDVPTTLIKKAAYIYDGEISFTLDETDADGSTLIESKKVDFWGRVSNQECPRINVECVDLSKVVREASKNYQKIVLKLDIEGAEYDVLEKLLAEDLVKHLTCIFAEFHWNKCGFSEVRHNKLLHDLKKQTLVYEWDALDFAVYCRSDDYKKKRSLLVLNNLSDISRYQNINFLQ